METAIQKERIEARLSLRELADLLGPGFSPARLSLAERNLLALKPHDENLILETIRRVAEVSRRRRNAIAAAKKIDLKEFTTDIREGRASACA